MKKVNEVMELINSGTNYKLYLTIGDDDALEYTIANGVIEHYDYEESDYTEDMGTEVTIEELVRKANYMSLEIFQ